MRAWDALVGWSRDLVGLRVWGMSPGSWAGDTGVQGRGLVCSQGVLRGPSRDPKCRQVSLECQAGGLGVAKDRWCRPGLTGMQSKGPGFSLRSWVWAGVLGVQSRALSRGQGSWLWIKVPTNAAANPGDAEQGPGAQPRG